MPSTGPGRRLAWRRLGRFKSAEVQGIILWANGIPSDNSTVWYGSHGTLGSMISLWFTGWFSTVNTPVCVIDLLGALSFVLLYEESCRWCLAGFAANYSTCVSQFCRLHVPLPSKMSCMKLFTPKTVGQTSSRDIVCYWNSVAIIVVFCLMRITTQKDKHSFLRPSNHPFIDWFYHFWVPLF